MKKLIPLLFSISAFSMLSCFSMHSFVNKDVNPNGKIAVIVGETKFTKENTLYADNFTAVLAAESKLKVLSQNNVKSVLGTYPERIQGPYKVFGMDEPKVDYERLDIDALAAIAKKLNVQYIYAFWLPSGIQMTEGGSELSYYWYYSELIEFPSGRIIAHGKQTFMYVSKGMVIGSAPKTIEEMCKIFSDAGAKDLIKNSGIGKL